MSKYAVTLGLIPFFLLLFCVACPAQTALPDFSGTWVRGADQIVIVQSSEMIKMTYTSVWGDGPHTYDRSYYLDGRGEVNGMVGNPKAEWNSKTTLTKSGIKSIAEMRDIASKRKLGTQTTTVYRLSKDGQSMTVEMEGIMPLPKETYKRK